MTSATRKISPISGTEFIIYNLNYTPEILRAEPYMVAFPAWRSQRYLPEAFDLPNGAHGKRIVIVSSAHIPVPERELAYSLFNMSEQE